MKRSTLKPGKPLERKSGLSRGKGLQRTQRPLEARRGAQKSISPASREQRAKVKAEGQCRVCAIPASAAVLDPAHICDRSLGGCDLPECVCPLCRRCHDLYDSNALDLLPFLTAEEQAHAVLHLKLVGALRRITNDRDSAR